MELLTDSELENKEISLDEKLYQPNIETIIAFDKNTGDILYIEASYGKAVFITIDLLDAAMQTYPQNFTYTPGNLNPDEDNPLSDMENVSFLHEEGGNSKYDFDPDSEDVRDFFEKSFIKNGYNEVDALSSSQKAEEAFYSYTNNRIGLLEQINIVADKNEFTTDKSLEIKSSLPQIEDENIIQNTQNKTPTA